MLTFANRPSMSVVVSRVSSSNFIPCSFHMQFRRLHIYSVLPRIEKGMVLLEEKGHFCSQNFILRALSHAELFSEGALHKLWATHPK